MLTLGGNRNAGEGQSRPDEGLGIPWRASSPSPARGRRGQDHDRGFAGRPLAELGQKVLVVDLDPQACLTFSLGLDPGPST